MASLPNYTSDNTTQVPDINGNPHGIALEHKKECKCECSLFKSVDKYAERAPPTHGELMHYRAGFFHAQVQCRYTIVGNDRYLGWFNEPINRVMRETEWMKDTMDDLLGTNPTEDRKQYYSYWYFKEARTIYWTDEEGWAFYVPGIHPLGDKRCISISDNDVYWYGKGGKKQHLEQLRQIKQEQ